MDSEALQCSGPWSPRRPERSISQASLSRYERRQPPGTSQLSLRPASEVQPAKWHKISYNPRLASSIYPFSFGLRYSLSVLCYLAWIQVFQNKLSDQTDSVTCHLRPEHMLQLVVQGLWTWVLSPRLGLTLWSGLVRTVCPPQMSDGGLESLLLRA